MLKKKKDLAKYIHPFHFTTPKGNDQHRENLTTVVLQAYLNFNVSPISTG